MDVYKKIQKELDKGKTVFISIEKSRFGNFRDRFRVLTPIEAFYCRYTFESIDNCCWKKSFNVNCREMKEFDKFFGLKIAKWQVLD